MMRIIRARKQLNGNSCGRKFACAGWMHACSIKLDPGKYRSSRCCRASSYFRLRSFARTFRLWVILPGAAYLAAERVIAPHS